MKKVLDKVLFYGILGSSKATKPERLRTMAKKPAAAAAAPAGPDLLAMLGVANTGTVAPKGAKKDETVWFSLTGVRIAFYKTVDTLVKSLTAIQKTTGTTIKQAGVDQYYIPKGIEHNAVPPNFKVKERGHVLTVILGKRADSSPLSDDELKILVENDLPFAENVTQEGALLLNTEVLTQDVLLALQAIIGKHPELPTNLITVQQKRITHVTTDKTLPALFAKKFKPTERAAKIRELLPLISTLSLKAGEGEVTKEDLADIEQHIFKKDEKKAA